MLTVVELIERARGQVGRGTIYRLGGGKTTGADPRDERGECDCSAFVCWALGLPKHQEQFAWLRKLNGGWFNTDGMWWDATKEPTGFFGRITDPAPGSIVVYPSRATAGVPGPSIGHVGIVTDAKAGKVTRVVHCSSGNWKKGDAIRETSPTGIFDRSEAMRLAWCALVA